MQVNKIMAFGALTLFVGLSSQPQEQYWTDTYKKAVDGYWGTFESLSGSGSSLEQTKVIREALPKLIQELGIQSILDVPCGDFNWMKLVDLGNCLYIGADIVKPLVEENNKKYASGRHSFLHLDVTKDELPRVDLVICRDLLVHLSLQDITFALRNFKAAGIRYLLTTTFTHTRPDLNSAIKSGGWRTVNLQKAPFDFPAPLMMINEHCTEQGGLYGDKSLALWDLNVIDIK